MGKELEKQKQISEESKAKGGDYDEIEKLINKKLVKDLVDIRKYGTDYFEYRIFYASGGSYSFSNYQLKEGTKEKDPGYLEAMSNHFSEEINLCFRNSELIHYIVRSEDGEDNLYLEQQRQIDFSNGISIYEFRPDKIRYFFFGASLIRLVAKLEIYCYNI